jgi:hypothetical protein
MSCTLSIHSYHDFGLVFDSAGGPDSSCKCPNKCLGLQIVKWMLQPAQWPGEGSTIPLKHHFHWSSKK